MADIEHKIWFRYRGPKTKIPDEVAGLEELSALGKADKEVRTVLNANGIRWKHVFTWSNGKIYRIVLSKKSDTSRVVAKLQELFADSSHIKDVRALDTFDMTK